MAHPITGKKFIRVETPITTDGITLKYDADRQPVFKTTNLPFTAKKNIEQNARRLPDHLRPKITVLDGDAEVSGKAKQKPSSNEAK